MYTHFTTWLVAFDYIFGLTMLILILKFLLNLLLNENNKFSVVRFFNKITLPILKLTEKVTPNFIVKPIVPLYVAWLIFMIRIYFLPLVLGYSSVGNFAFILEKDIVLLVNKSILNVALYINYGL